jgi:ribonuclease HI
MARLFFSVMAQDYNESRSAGGAKDSNRWVEQVSYFWVATHKTFPENVALDQRLVAKDLET